MFGDKAEVRKLSQRLANAHIVIAARDQAIEDLNLAYLTARGEVEELEARIRAMERAWNQAIDAGVVEGAVS